MNKEFNITNEHINTNENNSNDNNYHTLLLTKQYTTLQINNINNHNSNNDMQGILKIAPKATKTKQLRQCYRTQGNVKKIQKSSQQQ